ncbi:MAG TPA: M20/M25/M40 family metallo-hydrolase [Phenylobacterium sp.]|jgi:acetylornithine deacetylase/succinyl-diaminopimelate desuccinylase-like protein|uniref:M20/M25/M40 family metallo-hydrolase n=1 Tax=Phenylobacterium sp. TaxID=1871053 RepID=UPI002CB5DD06|nr:M20/M25/M40 family metallo-hydrolase [Phenylobacterium sp.]HXA40449.1 M20/M25/M40 family metallo-hydrolase [Phenylobacterium sp.]
MFKFATAFVAATALLAATTSQAQTRPDQVAFRALYKELVETNTTASVGDCTLAAQRMAAHLKAAGFPDSDLTIFAAPQFPKNGGLVAVYPGKDPKAKAILLLAHLDVVEAKREDWTRDPFTLVEEGGYFYGRGAADDKAQASIWVDTLIRYRTEGFHPRRTIKMALTCGEESGGPINGASWLMQNRRDLIDAEFALNEGAGGQLDDHGKRIAHTIEAGEKTSQSFTLEVTNPGGHSSRPVPDNAIYRLADALEKIRAYEFPVMINDANGAYLTKMSKVVSGETGAAMTALVANPKDARADALLSRDPSLHTMLRTTCVATMLSAGHAQNALPQRATANINCRIFPGVSREAVRAKLVEIIGDSQVSVSKTAISRTESDTPAPAPPLTPKVLGPIEKVSAEMWPGVPVVPILQAGATDGKPLTAGGIPTYGVQGLFYEPDLGRIHGLNERIGVTSLYEGRDFLYKLVKIYADQP